MALVIDASVAIARRLRDREGTPYADFAIERGGLESVVVPDLFWHEVRNVLLGAERKGRIDVGTAEDHLKDLRQLSIQSDGDQDDDQIAALARRHGLSGYDAAYPEMRYAAVLSSLPSTRTSRLRPLKKTFSWTATDPAEGHVGFCLASRFELSEGSPDSQRIFVCLPILGETGAALLDFLGRRIAHAVAE